MRESISVYPLMYLHFDEFRGVVIATFFLLLQSPPHPVSLSTYAWKFKLSHFLRKVRSTSSDQVWRGGIFPFHKLSTPSGDRVENATLTKIINQPSAEKYCEPRRKTLINSTMRCANVSVAQQMPNMFEIRPTLAQRLKHAHTLTNYFATACVVKFVLLRIKDRPIS